MPFNCVYGQSDLVAAWVAEKIEGCGLGFGECQAIGVYGQNDLAAGVVFHNWSPECGTIEASVAAITPRWATRTVLTEILHYPFSALQCRIVLARTAENNMRALKIWRALGATEHKLPDLRSEGLGEIVSLLKKEAWQKSRLYDGQR